MNAIFDLLFYLQTKHPLKVHIWPGISLKGRTHVCIFEGEARVASNRLGHNFIFKNITQRPFYRSTNTERDLFSDRYCIFHARQELHEVH